MHLIISVCFGFDFIVWVYLFGFGGREWDFGFVSFDLLFFFNRMQLWMKLLRP